MSESGHGTWPLAIDGHNYYSIPRSWLVHGVDDRDGEGPQIYAVSVAPWRDSLRIRYAHPVGGRVGQVIEPATDGDGGLIPRRLPRESWPRSYLASRLEPVGTVRQAEYRVLDARWDTQIGDDTGEVESNRLVADGGRSVDTASDRTLGGDGR